MGKLADGTPLNLAVYRAYRKAGLSDNQAKAITAEVGRENGFQGKYIFGYHEDPASSRGGKAIVNVGMISWNGGRGRALKSLLSKKGLLQGGKLARSQATIDEQAQFSVREMKSGKYASKLNNFWKNPNANPEIFSRELGKSYIVWAYGQSSIRKKGGGRKAFNWKAHDNRRKGHLSNISKMVGNGGGGFESQQQKPMQAQRTFLNQDEIAKVLPQLSKNQQGQRAFLSADEISKVLPQLAQNHAPQQQIPDIQSQPPQKKGLYHSITGELPTLKKQGMNPFQAMYSMAQRQDDMGQGIRKAYQSGISSEQLTNYFGVDKIWQTQTLSPPLTNSLQSDGNKASPIISSL